MSKYLLPFIVILATNIAFAGGNGSGGGDAECEARAKFIRDDITKWINADGPEKRKLDLTGTGFTIAEYSSQMINWLKEGNVIFSCVNPLALNQYPADVKASKMLLAKRLNMNGADKKCEWEMIDNNTRASVVCDSNYIRSIDFSNAQDRVLNRAQYVQIHHEFAGPAGIERPLNPSHPEDSNYSVSKQFEFFVGPELIESLQADPPDDGVPLNYDLAALQPGTKIIINKALQVPPGDRFGEATIAEVNPNTLEKFNCWLRIDNEIDFRPGYTVHAPVTFTVTKMHFYKYVSTGGGNYTFDGTSDNPSVQEMVCVSLEKKTAQDLKDLLNTIDSTLVVPAAANHNSK
jgi:hypothetical protein